MKISQEGRKATNKQTNKDYMSQKGCFLTKKSFPEIYDWMIELTSFQFDRVFAFPVDEKCEVNIIILPLIDILKFDWLRQIIYAAIWCYHTNLIF